MMTADDPRVRGDLDLVSIEEAARRFGRSRATINRWIRDGLLPVVAYTRSSRYVVWSRLPLELRALVVTGPDTLRERRGDDPSGES